MTTFISLAKYFTGRKARLLLSLALLPLTVLTACQPAQSDFPPSTGILPAIHQTSEAASGCAYPSASAHEAAAAYPYPAPVYAPNIHLPPAELQAPYPASSSDQPVEFQPDLIGASPRQVQDVEQRWGIHILDLSLVGGGDLVCFSFEVVDLAKADAMIAQANNLPLLVSEENKAATDPTVTLDGRSAFEPNGTYTWLYNNPRDSFEVGDLITIQMGDQKLEHVILQ